jgi:hypothetical protein
MKKKHQAKADHADMSSHAEEQGGDSFAHSSHHQANKEHMGKVSQNVFEGGDQYEDGGDNHHLGANAECDD